MQSLAGDGGEAGVGLENGHSVSMKRSVCENKFRHIRHTESYTSFGSFCDLSISICITLQEVLDQTQLCINELNRRTLHPSA